MKVLVVEDEPKVASFIKRGLEELAFSVDVAYDGIMGEKLAFLPKRTLSPTRCTSCVLL